MKVEKEEEEEKNLQIMTFLTNFDRLMQTEDFDINTTNNKHFSSHCFYDNIPIKKQLNLDNNLTVIVPNVQKMLSRKAYQEKPSIDELFSRRSFYDCRVKYKSPQQLALIESMKKKMQKEQRQKKKGSITYRKGRKLTISDIQSNLDFIRKKPLTHRYYTQTGKPDVVDESKAVKKSPKPIKFKVQVIRSYSIKEKFFKHRSLSIESDYSEVKRKSDATLQNKLLKQKLKEKWDKYEKKLEKKRKKKLKEKLEQRIKNLNPNFQPYRRTRKLSFQLQKRERFRQKSIDLAKLINIKQSEFQKQKKRHRDFVQYLNDNSQRKNKCFLNGLFNPVLSKQKKKIKEIKKIAYFAQFSKIKIDSTLKQYHYNQVRKLLNLNNSNLNLKNLSKSKLRRTKVLKNLSMSQQLELKIHRDGYYVFSKMLNKKILLKFGLEKSENNEEINIPNLEKIAKSTFENYTLLRQEYSNEAKFYKTLQTIVGEQKDIWHIFFNSIVENKLIEIISPAQLLAGMAKHVPKIIQNVVIQVPYAQTSLVNNFLCLNEKFAYYFTSQRIIQLKKLESIVMASHSKLIYQAQKKIDQVILSISSRQKQFKSVIKKMIQELQALQTIARSNNYIMNLIQQLEKKNFEPLEKVNVEAKRLGYSIQKIIKKIQAEHYRYIERYHSQKRNKLKNVKQKLKNMWTFGR